MKLVTSIVRPHCSSHEGDFNSEVPLCRSPVQIVASAVFTSHCRREQAVKRERERMDALAKQMMKMNVEVGV